MLRELRRRHARRTGGVELTYRQLAAATGWSHGIIGAYLSGKVLPPTERFDILVRLLGATPAEQGSLATARDRVEELRRGGASTARQGGGPIVRQGGALAGGVTTTAPRQLPADVPGFTGRTAALAALDELLDQRAEGAPTGAGACVGAPSAGPAARICVLAGSPGVGKTALAVHWAHRVAVRFPDGQFYLDLRGYDPERPVPPEAALAVLLRGLGLAPALIPPTTDERTACYRTLLADRRALVLLDNAHSADQVRPLLPGTGATVAVVTSRDDLAGLVARDGARRLALAVLSPAEAAALLRILVGVRVEADPAAAATLAERCAWLPLALRVAAEIATTHPDLTVAELLAELGDERRRLDLLGASGDRRTAVRAVFSWSYRQLTAGAARAFGLVGLHPGPDFDSYAVAALTGTTTVAAQAMVDELARAHLVERAGRDEDASHILVPLGARGTSPVKPRGTAYRMHDLLRAYAREQPTDPERRDALPRLYEYFVATAVAATRALFPHDRRPAVAQPRVPVPAVAGPEPAQRWLDRQRANLVAAGEHAARHGWPRQCVQLSETLWRYLEVGGHYQEALTLHTAAVAAADDGTREAAAALANLGGVHWWLGAYQEARDCYARSRAGHRAAGDRDGEARALARLGVVYERLGDYAAARLHLTEALHLYYAIGNRHGEGAQLVNLGGVYRRTGRLEEAAEHQRRAAAVFAEVGDRRLEGYARGNLGAVYGLLGRESEALAELDTALRRCRDSGDPGGEGSALAAIGAVQARLGRYSKALENLHRALATSREIADRGVEIEVLNTLGETLRRMAQPEAALERHRAALALAQQTGDQYERARAGHGIARSLAALGRYAQARPHAHEALDLYQRLGVPEAEEVQAFSKELR